MGPMVVISLLLPTAMRMPIDTSMLQLHVHAQLQQLALACMQLGNGWPFDRYGARTGGGLVVAAASAGLDVPPPVPPPVPFPDASKATVKLSVQQYCKGISGTSDLITHWQRQIGCAINDIC